MVSQASITKERFVCYVLLNSKLSLASFCSPGLMSVYFIGPATN